MREIGGYFELEHFTGSEYYPEAYDFNCARSALLCLLENISHKNILVPYFNCSEVFETLKKVNCDLAYYSIGQDLMPQLPRNLSSYDAIYIVNIFGRLDNEYYSRIRKEYPGNIIVDNTQAFFCKPFELSEKSHYIYSCRKFFGVSDGAYLSTGLKIKPCYPKDKSSERVSYICGRLEDGASLHYREFKDNEKLLSSLGVLCMSEVTHNILRAIKYEDVIKARNKNYKTLDEVLGKTNHFPVLCELNGPFMYPLYYENADNIRTKLAEKGIYIPLLWPNTAQMDSSTFEYKYSANLIAIPCDQRYTTEDMQYLLSILKEEL